MRPFFPGVVRPSTPQGSDEDLDSTVSFSDSEDDLPDPPALQQLARALLGWAPALVASYARLDHSPASIAPFSAFLGRLEREVAGQAATRGEIIGWLHELAADQAARSRAFQMVSEADAAGSALVLYQAMRKAHD